MKDKNIINIDFLNKKFDKNHFERLENNSLESLVSIKYNYSLKKENDYYFLGLKISDLYLKEVNGNVDKFKIGLKYFNKDLFFHMGKEFGKPRSITFLNEEYDSEFKNKFKKGEIIKDTDISYNKVEFCHWYKNENVIITFYNSKESKLSTYDGIEISFSIIR